MRAVLVIGLGFCSLLCLEACASGPDLRHQTQSSLTQETWGVRVSAAGLKDLFSGTTVHGRFVDNAVSFVERYESDGSYWVQYSQPVYGKFKDLWNGKVFLSGAWKVQGDLICYALKDPSFEDPGCVEIYERNGTLSFVVAPTETVVAVSTTVESTARQSSGMSILP